MYICRETQRERDIKGGGQPEHERAVPLTRLDVRGSFMNIHRYGYNIDHL